MVLSIKEFSRYFLVIRNPLSVLFQVMGLKIAASGHWAIWDGLQRWPESLLVLLARYLPVLQQAVAAGLSRGALLLFS